MAFVNRTRLPFKLTRPQFDEQRDIFTKANGQIVVLNSIVRKKYEGETDLWPEKLHDRFKIALSHDHVTIEGERYVGEVVQEGDYTINWSEPLDYPIAKAQFFVFRTPFDASNTNCGGCADFVQVVANDDIIPYDVPESHQISMNPLANDDVCCEPVAISLVTANSTYVASVIIVPETNSLVINTQPSFVSQSNVILVTYRVQCGNGQYDDANIIANMVGSAQPECLQATSLAVIAITSTTLHFDWTAPTPAPAGGYQYELHLGTNLGVPVESGTTADTQVAFGNLDPESPYRLYIRSDCGSGNFSNWQYIDTQTNSEDLPPICGRYRVRRTISSIAPPYRYYDCNGEEQFKLSSFNFEEVCMLQSSPGTPVYFVGGQFIVIEYVGPCT